ncbi:MAG TPA: hypothetical protein VFX38_07435 [Gammaproteobacteria bacterium]|nr:hypothetical protein [Gammaproteobacteria bacterium]
MIAAKIVAATDAIMARAQALAFRILAERIEHREAAPLPVTFRLPAAA